MANLLAQKQNAFYHDYAVNVCAGAGAGIGAAALEPVRRSMGDPLATKTITLSCGKLTTGVTIKPWTGIFMLRSLSSPETYFQAAFRVQSPWEVTNDDGTVGLFSTSITHEDYDAMKRAASPNAASGAFRQRIFTNVPPAGAGEGEARPPRKPRKRK